VALWFHPSRKEIPGLLQGKTKMFIDAPLIVPLYISMVEKSKVEDAKMLKSFWPQLRNGWLHGCVAQR